MTTAYVTHSRYADHTLDGHPENADRLYAIWARLAEAGVLADLATLEPAAVGDAHVEAVHQRRYLDLLATRWDHPVMLDHDTYMLPDSYEIARLAAGGAVRAVEAVVRGEADNALALVRPPGHHARPDRGMGFCLLNNVAVGARHAQRALGVERVLIVDYDVHHGNGTQEAFYTDPSVLYISTHQYPFYPGTGAVGEAGAGAGVGATINVPLRAGVGDEGYAQVFAEVVWPAAQRFAPHLILVSAGFDAHWADPLANMNLTLAGYAHLTRELVRMARALCAGRIVFVLEGGYNLTVLGDAVLNLCYALLGRDKIVDPMGQSRWQSASAEKVIQEVRQVHGLG